MTMSADRVLQKLFASFASFSTSKRMSYNLQRTVQLLFTHWYYKHTSVVSTIAVDIKRRINLALLHVREHLRT